MSCRCRLFNSASSFHMRCNIEIISVGTWILHARKRGEKQDCAVLCCAVPVLSRRMRLSRPIQVRSEEIATRINPSDDSPLLDKLFPRCKIRHVCTMPLSSGIVFLLDIPPRLAGHECSSQIISERISHIVNSLRVSLSQIWRIQFAPHSYLSIVQRPRHKPHVSRVRVQVIDWHTLIDWSVRKLSQASPSPTSAQNGAL